MLHLPVPIIPGGVSLPAFWPTVCYTICCKHYVSLDCCRFFTFFDTPGGYTGIFCLSWLLIVGLKSGAGAGVKVRDCTSTRVGGMTFSSSCSDISSFPLLVANG
jgi:hypothetical protein